MSTHNIGFYEDLTKFIFELSSNIIKYAPYFFCCNAYNLCLSTARDSKRFGLKLHVESFTRKKGSLFIQLQ